MAQLGTVHSPLFILWTPGPIVYSAHKKLSAGHVLRQINWILALVSHLQIYFVMSLLCVP